MKSESGSAWAEDIILLSLTLQYVTSMQRFLAFSVRCTADHAREHANMQSASEDEREKLAGINQHVKRTIDEIDIIYPIAMLESYINGVISFLFHFQPSRVLSDRTIEVRQLTSKSRAQVLNEQIDACLKAFSRDGMIVKLAAVEKKFGICFNITDEEKRVLKDSIILRNEFVHANYGQNIRISDDLKVEVEMVSVRSDIPPGSFARTVNVSNVVIAKVFEVVSTQVLLRELSDQEALIVQKLSSPVAEGAPS
jgi:hypothetical protein